MANELTIHKTKLDGVVIIDINAFRDNRGFFIENYHEKRFRDSGLAYTFVQDNHSRSGAKVLRGLHYQDMTAPMGKLVRCTVGVLFDVAVDLRVGSPTFGQWVGVELSADNMRQILVPPGFAHGIATLSDVAEVQYKCSGHYAPASEGAIRWNDPDVGIEWPFDDPLVSAKDANAESLQDYLKKPRFVYSEMNK